MTATALTIAGSDSGGGAGIQADLKTFSALGVYGASVITAITAQNTCSVDAVEPVSPAMIVGQLAAVLSDIPVHAAKVGMVGGPDAIAALVAALPDLPLVVDPVMIAKSGTALLPDDAVNALLAGLIPRATVLTPNLPEAARLLGTAPATSVSQMREQGHALRALGPRYVLMKGGHAHGPVCTDLLIGAKVQVFSAPRIDTRNTHGTGCSLSAAIAAGLAKGLPVPEAVAHAHRWLQGAILAADRLRIGRGHGPVHHFHEVWP